MHAPRKLIFAVGAITIACLCMSATLHKPQHDPHCDGGIWGFFGHKRINRLALLTLPPEMMVFYKRHIDYITEHAVDADARRYLLKAEGSKHFLDLDHFGGFPFANLPRVAADAQLVYTQVLGVRGADTLPLFSPEFLTWRLGANGRIDSVHFRNAGTDTPLKLPKWKALFWERLLRDQADEPVSIPGREVNAQLAELGLPINWDEVIVLPLSWGQHGNLPWNLQRQYDKLVKAFEERNPEKILKYSADIGHYIGDAHVPLHTVSNYNGQKTNQHGIHGFWETRIPELFADDEYDYFVGGPEHIQNMDSMIWETVFESHRYADTVLSVERMLRISFPQREQICTDFRSGKQVLLQCRNYARAYQDAMDGLVERRMREAIHTLSCVWYSAWVDAGKPDLSTIDSWQPTEADKEAWKELQKAASSGGKMIGRDE